jgi:hypothetical protein
MLYAMPVMPSAAWPSASGCISHSSSAASTSPGMGMGLMGLMGLIDILAYIFYGYGFNRYL